MSIQETLLKIKGSGKILIFRIISGLTLETLDRFVKYTICGTLILGGVFMLGWYSGSKMYSKVASPQTPQTPQIPQIPIKVSRVIPTQPTGNDSGNYIASKTGKVYYPKGCPGFSRIKPENRVYFTTSSEADSSGRTLSKKCAP